MQVSSTGEELAAPMDPVVQLQQYKRKLLCRRKPFKRRLCRKRPCKSPWWSRKVVHFTGSASAKLVYRRHADECFIQEVVWAVAITKDVVVVLQPLKLWLIAASLESDVVQPQQ
jgi:hypothetical protein